MTAPNVDRRSPLDRYLHDREAVLGNRPEPGGGETVIPEALDERDLTTDRRCGHPRCRTCYQPEAVGA